MKNESQVEHTEKGEDDMKNELQVKHTEKGEDNMKKELEVKADFTVEGDFIDTSKIENEEVRLLVEQMMKAAKAREEKLEESLEETRRELEEIKARRKGKTPPTVEWTNHLDDTLARIEEKNQTPLTRRQKQIIDKGIRMIARELTGVYRLNWENAKELVVLKAAADRIGDIVIDFGVPEETDPAFQKITKDWKKSKNKKETK